MSRQDQGAASGQQHYNTMAGCGCGHSAYVHDINTKGFRARCSANTPDQCPCRLYVAEEVTR